MGTHAKFDEAYMGTDRELKGSGIPGFGASNRTPASSRVSKTTRKVKTKDVPKGLPRSCVSIKRVQPRKWEVYLKASSDQRKIAVVERHHEGYGFMILIHAEAGAPVGRRQKPKCHYPTLKAAVDAMLLKL